MADCISRRDIKRNRRGRPGPRRLFQDPTFLLPSDNAALYTCLNNAPNLTTEYSKRHFRITVVHCSGKSFSFNIFYLYFRLFVSGDKSYIYDL